MSKIGDFAAGVTAVALAATVLIPRRKSHAEMLRTMGLSQAQMIRAMLGPIRCTKQIRWPERKAGGWLLLGCTEYGEHEYHVTVDGRVFTEREIEWMEAQYRLTTDGL